MIVATVHVDLGPLRRYASAIDSGLRSPGSNRHIRTALKQWEARYKAFLRERFSRLSRGGGEWPHLSLATLTSRRRRRGKLKTKKVRAYLADRKVELGALRTSLKGKQKAAVDEAVRAFNKATADDLLSQFSAKASILIDTGTLFGALDPGSGLGGKPGWVSDDVPYGVEVGYGGRALHPTLGQAALTIEQIAEFHQLGGGRLPQRKIVVPPDEKVLAGMADDLERALRAIAKETGNQ